MAAAYPPAAGVTGALNKGGKVGGGGLEATGGAGMDPSGWRAGCQELMAP